MKKVLLLALVATSFGMTSCKKEYTCSCTTTVYDTDVTPNVVLTGPVSADAKIKDTKDKAKTACESGTKTTTDATLGIKSVTTCAIK